MILRQSAPGLKSTIDLRQAVLDVNILVLSLPGLKSTVALRQAVPDVHVLETVCTWLEEHYCLKAGCT